MTLLAPIALLALLPWAAFATWVLLGRRRRQRVPFLPLWNAPEELRRPKKGFEPPPLSLLFALVATLCATLALARPLASARPPERHLTILVDRSATMSAKTPTGQPRFTATAAALAQSLANLREPIRIDLITVPSSDPWNGPPDQLPAAVTPLRRTAVDTSDELRSAVNALAAKPDPILVISDQTLAPPRPNIIPVPPSAPVRNTAITALAHRAGHVMVTLSATDPTTRTLLLHSGDLTLRQPVQFTSPGQRNVFLTFDPPTDLIEATLEGSDDFDADDRAYLVRGRPWPTLEPRSPLPDELRRMIDVYRRLRPPAESSPRLALGRPADVKSDEPAVLLAPLEPTESPRGEVRPTPHPITAGVDWKPLTQSSALATTGPPEGWTILARTGDHPILAVRETQPRQAWIGFDSVSFARTPSFVVLWTNLFDYVAAGSPDFHADILRTPITDATRLEPQPPPDVDPTRWPGIFQTATGPSAFNAPAVTFSKPSQDWPASLASLPRLTSASLDLTPWLALAALACLATAAATWERRRTAAPRPPAHLDVETLHLIETTFNADGHAHRHETLRAPHD